MSDVNATVVPQSVVFTDRLWRNRSIYGDRTPDQIGIVKQRSAFVVCERVAYNSGLLMRGCSKLRNAKEQYPPEPVLAKAAKDCQ